MEDHLTPEEELNEAQNNELEVQGETETQHSAVDSAVETSVEVQSEGTDVAESEGAVIEEGLDSAETETAKTESVEGASEPSEKEPEVKLTIEDVVEGEEEPEVAPVVKKKVINPKKWFSLRVISGKEKKIKERIELELQRNKWTEVVTQVLVPSEKVYKIRGGKKVILERNILPGYILIEAVSKSFRGEMITAIANIPNVIHFLGRNHPIPMHQSEANRMLGKVDESQDSAAAMIEPFIKGETVKIMDGPFKDFVGDIKEVNEEKKKLKVIVKIFGRGTEVELNVMQVEKQS